VKYCFWTAVPGVVLAAFVFLFGFKPALVLDLMQSSISSLITPFGG